MFEDAYQINYIIIEIFVIYFDSINVIRILVWRLLRISFDRQDKPYTSRFST